MPRATAGKKAAAARSRVTFRAASGETLKENASQLEVAERMLAELASRDQAEKDPAVAAQRALRAAILSGAVSPSSIVLKSAPAMKTNEELAAEARLAADKAAAAAAKAAAKAAKRDALIAAADAKAKVTEATTTELLRRLAEISANTGLIAIEPAEAEAAKAEERAAREEATKKKLKELKKKALEEEARRREAEDVAARMAEKARREKARDDAAADAARKLEELKALEGDKIKLAIAKAEAERVQREHTEETKKLIAAIQSKKGGDRVHIIFSATTGLPVTGYKLGGPKKNAMSDALKDKLKRGLIVSREDKYYTDGEPPASVLNLNRPVKTEPVADYDPAEEARLERELERAAEEARVLKERADEALEEAKVAPADYPKPGRPPLPAFLGDIGAIGPDGKPKLKPKDDRKPPSSAPKPKKLTPEEQLTAALKAALEARRKDIKELTDAEIAAEDAAWEEGDPLPPKELAPLLGDGRKSKSEIQAVGFPQDEWTPAQARRWLTEHGAKPIKPMRREGSWLRWRLTPPDRYSRYTTKTLRSNGRAVHLVMGWR